MRSRGLVLFLAAAALLAIVATAAPAAGRTQFVLSPEGNHLWAYDTRTGARQLLVQAVNGAEPGVPPPVRSDRRDINGQICVSPDGRHMVTGEDTVIAGAGGDGGSSHDPRIAGWGWFRLGGASLGHLWARQVGKLAPEAGSGPGYAGDPDNFGCGFLDARRLVTTAIGNILPGEPGNGQLFLWFGPFDANYRQESDDAGTSFFVGEVPHCQIDGTLATAGGIAVDANGDVYVTTNRPDDQGHPGSVWRFRGRWPTSPAECTDAYLAANITKVAIVPAAQELPADVRAPTPSSVVVSPDGTLYVASVFSGTVSEFTKAGTWLRDIYPLSPVTPFTGPTSNTPFGLAVTADGSLWIADLGIVLAQPGPGLGSLIRVRFSETRSPILPAETVQDGLTFPDGLGVYTAPRRR
jgi:hypothetical protein